MGETLRLPTNEGGTLRLNGGNGTILDPLQNESIEFIRLATKDAGKTILTTGTSDVPWPQDGQVEFPYFDSPPDHRSLQPEATLSKEEKQKISDRLSQRERFFEQRQKFLTTKNPNKNVELIDAAIRLTELLPLDENSHLLAEYAESLNGNKNKSSTAKLSPKPRNSQILEADDIFDISFDPEFQKKSFDYQIAQLEKKLIRSPYSDVVESPLLRSAQERDSQAVEELLEEIYEKIGLIKKLLTSIAQTEAQWDEVSKQIATTEAKLKRLSITNIYTLRDATANDSLKIIAVNGSNQSTNPGRFAAAQQLLVPQEPKRLAPGDLEKMELRIEQIDAIFLSSREERHPNQASVDELNKTLRQERDELVKKVFSAHADIKLAELSWPNGKIVDKETLKNELSNLQNQARQADHDRLVIPQIERRIFDLQESLPALLTSLNSRLNYSQKHDPLAEFTLTMKSLPELKHTSVKDRRDGLEMIATYLHWPSQALLTADIEKIKVAAENGYVVSTPEIEAYREQHEQQLKRQAEALAGDGFKPSLTVTPPKPWNPETGEVVSSAIHEVALDPNNVLFFLKKISDFRQARETFLQQLEALSARYLLTPDSR